MNATTGHLIEVPTEKVYGPTQDRALRLITCDGDFDAQGHPVNNLIVYAKLR